MGRYRCDSMAIGLLVLPRLSLAIPALALSERLLLRLAHHARDPT
jgi:hypothetical protein